MSDYELRDVSEDERPNDGRTTGAASVAPKRKKSSYDEYDEARRLLRDMDERCDRRRQEGILNSPNPRSREGSPEIEPFIDHQSGVDPDEDYRQYYHTYATGDDSDDGGVFHPPADYSRSDFRRSRPIPRSSTRSETPAEPRGRPVPSRGDQSSLGRPSKGRAFKARFADQSPRAASSSRSRDADFGQLRSLLTDAISKISASGPGQFPSSYGA